MAREITMSTPEQRMRMAKQIVDFEARRDKKGHLQVYKLPAWDKAEELATEYADRRSRAASACASPRLSRRHGEGLGGLLDR